MTDEEMEILEQRVHDEAVTFLALLPVFIIVAIVAYFCGWR